MYYPGLSPEHFLLDRVAERECLFSSREVAKAVGARLADDMAHCTARGRLVVALPLGEPDLSRFNSLGVTLCNRSVAPLLAGIRLVHELESVEHPCPATSFTGGREFVPPGRQVNLTFPVTGFGWYRGRRPWTSVYRIELALVFEKTHDGPDEIEVLVGAIEGEMRDPPRGPRLTSEGLAEVFEEDVTSFVSGRHNLQPGRSAGVYPFSPYNSENIALRIPPPHPYPRETADDILNGRIMCQRLPSPLPWDADPIGAHEWAHFLHRHHFLRKLIVAFAETRDARYVRAVDELIAQWIASNPVPVGSNGGAGPSWETLTAAWRLREWLWVVGMCWPAPWFREDTKRAMLRSVWEHAHSLADHQGHPTNWIIVESAALALAGICFPWFRNARAWREKGLERLAQQYSRQFFSDGVHFEISPLYHAICLGAILEVQEAAHVRGIELPADLREYPDRCIDYLMALCRPDFTWPSLNDSGSAQSDFTALLRKAGELLGREDLVWIGSRGRCGTRPQERSSVFEDAGIAVMRSGYDTDANMLVFRAGPAGAGHVHEDALSLDVTALGVPRLVDPGVTTYAPDVLTDHYRSPEAHSMVLVGGRGLERSALPFGQRVRPAGGDFAWERRGRIEVASGVQAGLWPGCRDGTTAAIAVTRTVVFVDSQYWVVRDMVLGDGPREVSVSWQFAPGRVEIDVKSLVVRCVDERGARFELIPLEGPSPLGAELATGMLFPPRGWVSLGGMDLPATQVRFTAAANLPFCLIWALLPYAGGESSGVRASLRHATDGRATVEIAFGTGHKDRLVFDAPHEPSAISQTARALNEVTLETDMGEM